MHAEDVLCAVVEGEQVGEQAVCISEAGIASWTMKQLFYDREAEMKRLMPFGLESARRAGVRVE